MWNDSNSKSIDYNWYNYHFSARAVVIIVVVIIVVVIIVISDTATRVQILDETDYISHSTNTLGKGMNPIILPPAMGK